MSESGEKIRSTDLPVTETRPPFVSIFADGMSGFARNSFGIVQFALHQVQLNLSEDGAPRSKGGASRHIVAKITIHEDDLILLMHTLSQLIEEHKRKR